jgi:hypothetical protein
MTPIIFEDAHRKFIIPRDSSKTLLVSYTRTTAQIYGARLTLYIIY